MQTTLLGLGLALIAAILAAFAAPFFIDWNEWRPQLEAQASALAGSRVTIAGTIDLTLLPTPAFVLREVSLGDAEKGSGMRAAEMRGSLSLTALISGKIEASEFVLSRPAIRLVVEKDGTLLLPQGEGAGQEISVSGFVIETGTLVVEDRRTNSIFAADDFSARGEVVSREGPFRLDGGFRIEDMRWILRASSGRFGPDHSGKMRLSLERPSDMTLFDAEGVLALANATPRFEGKAMVARRSGALPWRVSADTAGDVSELRFANLELALGEGELPITLTGDGKLVPRANGALEISLASKRIDLDLGDPKAAATGAAHVLPWLAEARQLLGTLPLPAQLSFAADGILAGGQLIRDVRAGFRTQNGVVALERLEARLPGRAAISLSGRNKSGKFSGPLSFEAAEPQLFARWLLGETQSGKLVLPSAFNVKGNLDFEADRYALRKLQISAGPARIAGSVEAILYSQPGDYRVEAQFSARDIDLDAALPAVRGALSIPDNIWLVANLVADNARVLNAPVRRVSISMSQFFGGAPELTALAVDDLEGLSLSAKRNDRKERQIEFSADASRGSGFAKTLEYLTGNADFASIAARYAESHFPLRLAGTLTPQKNGWRVAAKSGDAALHLDLGELRDARQPAEIILRLPETEISAKGEFRFGADGRFEPLLAVNFKSADLRKAFVLAERAAADALSGSGTANVVRDGNNIVFDKLAFELAGSRGTGRIAIPAGAVSPFAGTLSLDRADAVGLISLALGRAKVSYLELGVPLLANWPGTLKLEVGSLTVSERISLQKASFQVRAGRFETVFDDFRAQLAGGKLSGSLRVADTIPRVLEINLSAEDVALAQLFATQAVRGNLRTNITLGANGRTEEDLLASLSGRGTLALSNLEIERADATAVARVYRSVKDAPDEKKIEQELSAALDRTSLKVGRIEAPLVITNGVVRSGSAKAQAGNIVITLSGTLDIPKRNVDSSLSIEVTDGSSVKPGAIVRWTGKLDALQRSVDAKALTTAITLRAIERGAQNPSNINLRQDDRVPPAKKKRPPSKSDVETVPLLPPPASVAPTQPRSEN